jgi:hypothetical protein
MKIDTKKQALFGEIFFFFLLILIGISPQAK